VSRLTCHRQCEICTESAIEFVRGLIPIRGGSAALQVGGLAMLRLPVSAELPVYGWERPVPLRHLLDQGLKKTDIAARLGVSRGLIYHWLRTGQLDRELDVPRAPVLTDRPAQARPVHADHRRPPRDLSRARCRGAVRGSARAGYACGLGQPKCCVPPRARSAAHRANRALRDAAVPSGVSRLRGAPLPLR
jgi:transposase-like protein